VELREQGIPRRTNADDGSLGDDESDREGHRSLRGAMGAKGTHDEQVVVVHTVVVRDMGVIQCILDMPIVQAHTQPGLRLIVPIGFRSLDVEP
jgi:hypothetical protein